MKENKNELEVGDKIWVEFGDCLEKAKIFLIRDEHIHFELIGWYSGIRMELLSRQWYYIGPSLWKRIKNFFIS